MRVHLVFLYMELEKEKDYQFPINIEVKGIVLITSLKSFAFLNVTIPDKEI